MNYDSLQYAMSVLDVIVDWHHHHNSPTLLLSERTTQSINSHMFLRTWWLGSCSQTIPINLLTVLSTSRQAVASDKRDKIYAVLGLAVDAHEIMPKPDYDITPAQTYKTLIKSYILVKNDLEIICYAGKPMRDNQLPTWTPDWSNDTFANSFSTSTAHRECIPSFYRAGSVLDIRPSFSSDLTRMVVYGYAFDEVLSITNGMTPEYHEFNQTSSCRSAYEDDGKVFEALCSSLFAQAKHLGRTDLKIYQQKLVEICRQIFPAREKTIIKDPVSDWYEENKQFQIQGRTVENWVAEQPKSFHDSPITIKSSYDEPDPFRQSFRKTTFCRRIFTTEKGYIGVGPADACQGDILCILPGCSVPLVLRRRQWHHELIGDCYVHGIMDGEVIDRMCPASKVTSITSFTLL